MDNKENPMLLLTYIETEVNEGKKFFSGNKVLVEVATMHNLIDRLKDAIKEMSGQNLIEDAKVRAREIVELANERRNQLLDEALTNQGVYEKANTIIQQTKTEKQKLEQNLADNMYNALDLIQQEIEGYNNRIGALNKQLLDNIKSAKDRIVNKTSK
ncbi:MAG: hypothetical protein K5765_08785 [Clostridia bacterium]|nr:hypothetical protein [Clostridia bacterium]